MVIQDGEFWKYKLRIEFDINWQEKDENQSFRSLYLRQLASATVYRVSPEGHVKLSPEAVAIHDRFYITAAGYLYCYSEDQCLDSLLLPTKELLYPNKKQKYLRTGVQAIAIGKDSNVVTDAMILDFNGDVYTIGFTLNGREDANWPLKLISGVRSIGSSVLHGGYYYVTKTGDLFATDGRERKRNATNFHFIDFGIKSVDCKARKHVDDVYIHLFYTKGDGYIHQAMGSKRSGAFTVHQILKVPPVKLFCLLADGVIILTEDHCYWLELGSIGDAHRLTEIYGNIVNIIPDGDSAYVITEDNFCYRLTFMRGINWFRVKHDVSRRLACHPLSWWTSLMLIKDYGQQRASMGCFG